MEQDLPNPEKRTDVGYKRPPPEHQFQKGQKPPPRKRKEKRAVALKPSELLWQVLQEERRVVIGEQVRWMTTLEVLIRKAFEVSEKGNPTIRRLAMDLLLRADGMGEEDDEIRWLIDGEESPRWSGSP